MDVESSHEISSSPSRCGIRGRSLVPFGSTLDSAGEGVKFAALIPLSMLGLTVRTRQKLLHPAGRNAQPYQDWPEYWTVSSRFYITFWITVVCAGTALSVWIFRVTLDSPLALLLFFAPIAMSLVSYVHLWHAVHSLLRILATER